MKKILFLLSIALVFTHCGTGKIVVENNKGVLVESEADLDKYVGKLITITGEVSNTKIPQILGVDVSSDDPDLRGEMATATGILKKWMVTEGLVKNNVANRGAGIFYRLKDLNSDAEAQVQKVKKAKK